MNDKTLIHTWESETPELKGRLSARIYQLYPENVFEAHVDRDGEEIDSFRGGSVEQLQEQLRQKYESAQS